VLGLLAFAMQLITDRTAKLVDRRRTAAG
jgi:D-methionine transport system permease protein